MATAKKPVMDVSKPGKTPANATARPIIVNHGPAIPDPMVTPEAGPNPSELVQTEVPKPLSAPSTAHKVIAPITDDTPSETTEAPAPEDVEQVDEVSTEQPKIDEPEEQSDDDPMVDPAGKQRAAEKQKEEKLVEEGLKRQELVDSLVAEKKYFLPIGVTQRKRNSRIALVLLVSLLPLIVGVVLAMDAGVIDTGITLPFDLIKQ